MAEPFRGARLIPQAGYTLPGLNVFVGVKNAHTTAQLVAIAGPKIYDVNGKSTGLCGTTIGLYLGIGQELEVKCNHIRPITGNVLGLLG
jgi:hypothetical protein